MNLNEVVYSEKFLFGFGGVFYCAPFPGLWQIRIKPKYKKDTGLKEHELKHKEQYERQPWTYFWRMLRIKTPFFDWVIDPEFKLKCEVECYKEQLKYSTKVKKDRAQWLFAKFISENYGLKISIQDAYELLR